MELTTAMLSDGRGDMESVEVDDKDFHKDEKVPV